MHTKRPLRLTAQVQVAIYETVMADTNRHINYNLLYSASYLKDNRIPPRGFSSLGGNYDASIVNTQGVAVVTRLQAAYLPTSLPTYCCLSAHYN